MDHQDWETVVFKKRPDAAQRKAHQPPAPPATMSSVTNRPAWKIEQTVDNGERLPMVSSEDAKAIVAARVHAKLTRAQLAQRLNLQVKVIDEIETCKAYENKALVKRIKGYLAACVPTPADAK